MSNFTSPCAACKFLRRKCTQECVFAPYFPPNQPLKFTNVHKVFGASNVAKLLIELDTNQRPDAVTSLTYEAEARLQDPVYGCVGMISLLQHRLKQVQTHLHTTKQELAAYVGSSPQPHLGFIQIHSNMQPYMMQSTLSFQGSGTFQDAQYQHQLYEANEQHDQLIDATREVEMIRNFQQQQQPQPPPQYTDLTRFNSGFYTSGQGRFTQLAGLGGLSPSLALGGSYDSNMRHHHQLELTSPPQFQPQPHHDHGDDNRRVEVEALVRRHADGEN